MSVDGRLEYRSVHSPEWKGSLLPYLHLSRNLKQLPQDHPIRAWSGGFHAWCPPTTLSNVEYRLRAKSQFRATTTFNTSLASSVSFVPIVLSSIDQCFQA